MPHSTFLMHDGFSWGGDSTAKLQDRLKFETEQMAEVIKQYVISTTKITSKMFDKVNIGILDNSISSFS